MTYTAKGTLHHIGETQQVSDKFKKREFVIEIIDGNYKELIKFELKQDKCDILNNSHKVDEVEVSFNLRGREWVKDGKTMYFTSLEAWKVDSRGNETTQPAPSFIQPELPDSELIF